MEIQNLAQEFLYYYAFTYIIFLAFRCFIIPCCRASTQAGQDAGGGQPSNAQQDVEQPPLPPAPLPKRVLGTIISCKSRETGESTSDDICVICLEKWEDGDQCRVLCGCKHMYHEFCIDQWLARDRHALSPLSWFCTRFGIKSSAT
ncbi:hypothetical protein PTKIN_Ptkin11bG0027600 [Pterospermum kingtungense]